MEAGVGLGSLRLIRAVRVAVAAALIPLLAGCTTVVAGVAVKAHESTDPGGVNVALLDTGAYPTHAGHPFGTAGNAANGAYLEAVRMAEFVAGPWEIDATLRQAGVPTGALSIENLKTHLAPGVSDVAAARGFITSFATSRGVPGDGPAKGLSNLVMRFPDDGSAAAAATEMASKTLQAPDRRPASIPRHPEAAASAYDSDLFGSALESFTAPRPFTLLGAVAVVDDPDVIAALNTDGYAATEYLNSNFVNTLAYVVH